MTSEARPRVESLDAESRSVKPQLKATQALEATLTVSSKAAAKPMTSTSNAKAARLELAEDRRLTERRNTEEGALKLNLNDSVDQEKNVSLQHSPARAGFCQDGLPAGNSSRHLGASSVLKSLAGPSRGRRESRETLKTREKGLNQTTSLTEKFNTRRKVVNSPAFLGLSSNSFTQKQTTSPLTNPLRLAQTVKVASKTGIREKKEDARGYLLPSEVEDLETRLEGAPLEAFTMQHLLGKGAYASTYFGVHLATNLGLAMKVYTYSEKNLLKSSIDSEINILKKISHPNIVRLFHHCEKPGKTVLCLE